MGLAAPLTTGPASAKLAQSQLRRSRPPAHSSSPFGAASAGPLLSSHFRRLGRLFPCYSDATPGRWHSLQPMVLPIVAGRSTCISPARVTASGSSPRSSPVHSPPGHSAALV
jgi:hypothetical protein